MNMQWPLMIAISVLVGLASAGLVWTGVDLVAKLRQALGAWLAARKAKAEAPAEEDEDALR
ncbi:MAG: hypothetical protein RLZZ303_1279 [Candidatus Hydrogenedentota bacterium]|jgi:hypothetical protein